MTRVANAWMRRALTQVVSAYWAPDVGRLERRTRSRPYALWHSDSTKSQSALPPGPSAFVGSELTKKQRLTRASLGCCQSEVFDGTQSTVIRTKS